MGGDMTRRMLHPEDVSHDHVDATVMGFLNRERNLEWTTHERRRWALAIWMGPP
jgi:hypothetical protein